MGSRYLLDLADVCRAAGLDVTEHPGWQTRARGSGGYDPGRPTHVMVHHTASAPGSDPAGDVAYIATGADAAPLANLYLSRSGAVTVIAAGATNTNGSGSAPWPGGCPDDQMNTHAIGVEAANRGTGEPWPYAQQAAYVTLCAALAAAYGIANGCVRGHAEWAPARKIDPAGQSQWAAGAATWRLDLFRADVDAASSTPPTPTPTPPGGDDMEPVLLQSPTTIGVLYGAGKLVALDEESLAAWSAVCGPAIAVSQAVFDQFAARGY